jgi:guanylate kinase
MILDNFFLEWSFVHNHHYGSSSLLTERVLCNGINLIFDIDVNGGLQIKQQYPNAVLVFILPISNFELKKRLIKRGTESEKFITERVKIASREIDIGLKKYDYIIENIDVDKAFIDLSNIIYNHTLY